MSGYYNWQTFEFDEEVDLDVCKCLMFDVLHFVPIIKPLTFWVYAHGNQPWVHWAYEKLSIPTALGWDWKSIDGYCYIAPIPIPEEKVAEREPMFRERMRPWIEDFEGEWRGKLVPEIMMHNERLRKFDVEKAGDAELLEHFEDWAWLVHKSWQIHFLAMVAVFTTYGLFDQMCRELVGIDENHPQFKALMGGFDNKLFEVDRGLWRLGDRAKELGLEPLFQATPDDEELLAKLEESEPGRRWLQEFREFLQEHGWRTSRIYDCAIPTWIEKPSLAMPNIRRSMAKGGVFALDEEQKRLVKEREEAERDILSRVPEDQRGWFEKLMRAAQWAGRYSEEHTYYTDLYTGALGRRATLEIGKRYARQGVLDDPEDIFFLIPEEIQKLGIIMRGTELRKLARIRKEQWQEFEKLAPKMAEERLFIGDPAWFVERVAKDPVLRVFGGVRVVRPELKADLYGAGSAPGVVEGRARVVMAEAQLHEVQPGDILVAPNTSSAWNPVFAFIKGVVTDAGGNLAHAVIVGREYGIPVVAGTEEATRKIETGMRIRVDGDMCAVYILG